jgi:hypothetical protein
VEFAPGCVLAVGRLRLIQPGRGLADSPGVWTFTVANGRISEIRSYRSEREATQALQTRRCRKAPA